MKYIFLVLICFVVFILPILLGIIPNYYFKIYFVFIIGVLIINAIIFLKNKTLAKKIFILINAVFVSFSVLEILLRLFISHPFLYRPHEIFGRIVSVRPTIVRYRPNIYYEGENYGDLAAMLSGNKYRQWRKIRFITDNYGFVNNKHNENKITDVIILGDSFGAGTGTTQEKSWGNVLGNNEELNIYNFSIPGSPQQSLIHFCREIDRLNVDENTIILFTVFSGNDLDDYYPRVLNSNNVIWFNKKQTIKNEINRFRNKSRLLLWKFPPHQTDKNIVMIHKLFDKYLLFNRNYYHAIKRTYDEVKVHPNYFELKNTILKMNEKVNNRNLNLIVVLFPPKSEVYSHIIEGEELHKFNYTKTGFSNVLFQLCKSENIKYYDMKQDLVEIAETELLENNKLLYWYDDSHFNELGNYYVAELLAKKIRILLVH